MQVDATLFGVLAQIVYAPYESEHLNAIKNDFPNIMEYVERIKSRLVFFKEFFFLNLNF